jgi:hypothetical protein
LFFIGLLSAAAYGWFVNKIFVQAHLTAGITAHLTGEAIRAFVFFLIVRQFFRDIDFSGKSFNFYKRHHSCLLFLLFFISGFCIFLQIL